MSYDRCEKHNLARCMMCSPKAPPPVRPVVSTAASLNGWSPEDALDQMPPTGAPASVTRNDEPDTQALEAIARQKEILKARGELAGTPEIVEVALEDPTSAIPDTVLQAANAIRDSLVEKVFKPISEAQEAIETYGMTPVEKAARELKWATLHAESAITELNRLRSLVQEAEKEVSKWTTTRDEKKTALQSLVAAL